MKNEAREKMENQDLDKVSGGVAWVDDFIAWVSQKAGKKIKEISKD